MQKVCMFVFNNCTNDARVLKEAESLTEAGCDVRIIAVLTAGLPNYEECNGFRIIRVKVAKNWLRILFKPIKIKGLPRRMNSFPRRVYRLLRHTFWKMAAVPFFLAIYRTFVKPLIVFRRKLVKQIKRLPKRIYRLSKRIYRLPKRIIWKLAEVPFLLAIYHALARPLIVFTRKLLGRKSQTYSEKAPKEKSAPEVLQTRLDDEKGPSQSPVDSEDLQEEELTEEIFQEHLSDKDERPRKKYSRLYDMVVKEEISKDSIKKLIQFHPVVFFTIGWFILGVRIIFKKIMDAAGRFYENYAIFPVYSSYYRHAFKVVKGEPAAVYHAHDLNTLPVAYRASKRHRAKLVYDSHELFIETSTLLKAQKRIWEAVERRLILHADKVVTVNRSIAEELSNRYNIPLPYVVMNAPRLSSNPLRSKKKENPFKQMLGLEAATPLILYQGRYTASRGLENLVLAAHSLEQGVIVFMGWGLIEEELRKLVRSEKLDDRIKFTAPVPYKLLLKTTRCADLGIIPYRFIGLNNYYTTPNKLFEYMMAGLPVVGSDFPELRRIILEYGLGKVFNPDDPQDIARAINDVLSDPVGYRSFRESSKKAAKVFNWENESKMLVSAYKEMENG